MGIQISGLLSNSAFDWKSIVDQLIAADSVPVTTLTKEKTTNTDQITALAAVQTSLQDLQDSLQSMRSGNVFSARNVSSDVAGTTWKSSSVTGTSIGSYKFAVSQLATAAQITGAGNIGSALSTSSDVSGLTLATLRTATAVTAGTFSINGQQVTIATTDSLQAVFGKISDATGGNVTASYDPVADGITLKNKTGNVAPIVIGAANDTSNFLTVIKLSNSSNATTLSSSASLGTVTTAATLAQSGLTGDFTSGGAFLLNGVSFSYTSTDTLSGIINRINQSSAGVTVSYDSSNDRVQIVNKTTGDVGIGAKDTSGGLLAALGLTAAAGGTLVHGKNALFKVNDGPTLSSTTNTLDASTHGISGLSVTVNSETTQTLQIDSDTNTMQTAIQAFIEKFNATQDLIETDTKVDTTNGTITTSVLSNNREVQSWASQLRALAFEAVTGATGTVQRLDNLGIDFDSTTGHLAIKDSGKLATALGDHPDDVNNFFLNGSTGFVPKLYSYLTNIKASDSTQQSNIGKANSDLDTQIATLQSRLDDERTNLTNSFMAMLDAQSKAQSQQSYLTTTFFNNNSNSSCWVARAVYGARNPRWLVFRHWLLHCAPPWFRALYLRHGERFAAWLADKPWLQAIIRRWMDARIARLVPALALP